MNGMVLGRCAGCAPLVVILGVLLTTSAPASAQVELGGSYAIRMHEDYIERGPGSFMGDFTGTSEKEARCTKRIQSPGI